MNDTNSTRDAALALIARNTLDIADLTERKSDRLDFHEVAVWNVKTALAQAFAAGREAASIGGQLAQKRAELAEVSAVKGGNAEEREIRTRQIRHLARQIEALDAARELLGQ